MPRMTRGIDRRWLMMTGRAGALALALAAGVVAVGCTDSHDGPAPMSQDEVPGAPPESDGGDMVLLPGGTFRMGAADGLPHEAPVHRVTLRPFWIDRHEVTVAQFRAFVRATNHVTTAEQYGWSAVFDGRTHQWTVVDGATWRTPEGPHAPPASDDEPVTQVSHDDATAYARWAGKRLPTEAEFEYAARGGLAGATYAWGNDLRPGGRPAANWWQGTFPEHNTAEDGFAGRAPVMRFAANGHGLHDLTGNVWEWCADWFDPVAYAAADRENPTGPTTGEARVIRGGSFPCAENYCSNYRVAGRGQTAPDSGLNHLGFRCARDADASDLPPPAPVLLDK